MSAVAGWLSAKSRPRLDSFQPIAFFFFFLLVHSDDYTNTGNKSKRLYLREIVPLIFNCVSATVLSPSRDY